MVVFGQSGCIWAKGVLFKQSAYIRQNWLYSCKVVVFWQSDCILAKVVVLGEIGCNREKVVLFGQKWLFLGKAIVFGQKWL